MKILAVRHGQTDWNKENLVQGAADNPLNEEGLRQAVLTGENLKGRKIDQIYSSPLIRARQTAQSVANEIGYEKPIIYTDALREQNFGIYEGVPRDDEEYQKEKHLIFKRFDKGESFLDVAARVYPFLDDLIENAQDDEVILLSAHGGILRMIASYFEDLGNEQFTEYFAKNCEAVEFDVDPKTFLTSRKRVHPQADFSSKETAGKQ